MKKKLTTVPVDIVVISHSVPYTVAGVLDALPREDVNLHILLSGGPSLLPAIARCVPSDVNVIVAPEILPIGDARDLAMERTTADWVVFLDDDCVPYDGWFDGLQAAIAADSRAALVFGPRDPDEGSGLGTSMRRSFTMSGRKLRAAASGKRLILDYRRPLRLNVAGGNMAVRRSAVAGPVTSDAFRALPYEDVDLQIRLLQAGWVAVFEPAMRVRHEQDLSFRGVLAKAHRTGRAQAQFRQDHGRSLSGIRSLRACILRLVLLVLAGIGLTTVGLEAPVVLLICAGGSRAATGRWPGHELLSMSMWPVHDAVLVAGWASHRVALVRPKPSKPVDAEQLSSGVPRSA